VKKFTLIVAGGSGTRMKSTVPKQFLLLRGVPVLMRTLEAFHRFDPDMPLRVVLPSGMLDNWKELCRKYGFDLYHELGAGGETRFHSVQKNLHGIADDYLVAIHDGVRPLVSKDTIGRCFDTAAQLGNAIPCISIPESMRVLTGDRNMPVDRSRYRLIQTPQVFLAGLLKKAYLQPYQSEFTDDAGVVESLGNQVHLVEGNPENIKITWKKDLKLAGILLNDVLKQDQYQR
jgi:2-C-methyl-D-erythritol 4-phosphate cytidylyltransferase